MELLGYLYVLFSWKESLNYSGEKCQICSLEEDQVVEKQQNSY